LLYYQKSIKTFKNILLLSLITTACILQAQEIKCGKKLYIKPAFNYGFILQHRAAMGHLITGYVPMGEFNLVRATDGCKMWHCENNTPDYGLAFTYMDFGNPKVLGSSYSISPFIEIPLRSRQKASVPIIRVSWGLAYVTRHFDIAENHKNIAIGSAWNAFVQYRFLWHINLNEKFRFEPGLGISHVSNGRFQVPNLGLNLISVNLGLTYKLQDPKCEKTVIDSSTQVPSRHEVLVWGSFGLNDNYPPGNSKMNAYTASFNYSYNMRNTSKFGVGADFYYEESYLRELDQYAIPYSTALDQIRIGAKVCYSYNFGRISLPIEMGAYIWSKKNDDGPIFHRFGVRYTGKKGLMVQFALKSHWAIAYHFDIGVGYRIALKEKNRVKE